MTVAFQGEPAEFLHRGDGRVVERWDAVEQYVPVRRADQERPLANPGLRLRVDRVQVRLLLGEHILVRLLVIVEGRPLLPGVTDVLPLVQTDRAAVRFLLGRCVLHPAGDADEVLHSGCSGGSRAGKSEGGTRGGRVSEEGPASFTVRHG